MGQEEQQRVSKRGAKKGEVPLATLTIPKFIGISNQKKLVFNKVVVPLYYVSLYLLILAVSR